MKYCALNGLALMEIELPTIASSFSLLNHLIVIDRSGSMTPYLQEMIADLQSRVDYILDGETVSLGWFSSEGGDFGWVVKGFRLNTAEDRYALRKMMVNLASARNCTCFSEIMQDTAQVVKDLQPLGNPFALHFFTDGYPVVDNYRAEITALNKALAELQPGLSTSLIVGYGNYNKQLLAEMAERLGAVLLHARQARQFGEMLERFSAESRLSGGKRRVDFVAKAGPIMPVAIFGFSGGDLKQYSLDDHGNLWVDDNVDKVYVLSAEKPTLKTAIYYYPSAMEKAAYASALVMSQRLRNDTALEILGTLGDVRLIDLMNNAFTVAEFGNAENAILEAVQDEKTRYLRGKNEKYLPVTAPFCLLDAIDLMMQDTEARFYPRHPEFHYQAIGSKSRVKNGYPPFEADDNASCPFQSLTWNDHFLNLSILTQVKGWVQLAEGAEALGFAQKYPAFVWRNYALVKDGQPNVEILPVSVSKTTYNILASAGVLRLAEPWTPNGIYLLELSACPVMNRATVKDTSATALGHLKIQELNLMAELKVNRDLLQELTPTARAEKMANAQADFLLLNGIRENGEYSPPTETEKSSDFYLAHRFDIKIENFSKLPSLNEVRQQVQAGKTLTPARMMMSNYLAEAERTLDRQHLLDTLDQLEKKVSGLKLELNRVRQRLQRFKFAIVLGRRWFDEFSSRENCKLTIDGFVLAFDVKEEKVDL